MNFINNDKLDINNTFENRSNDDTSLNPLKSVFFNYLNDIPKDIEEIKNEEIKKIDFDSLYEINDNSDPKMICVLIKIIIYMNENRILNLNFKYNTESVASKLLATFEKITSLKIVQIFYKFKNSNIFNQDEIFEIAKICAQKDPRYVVYDFKDFEFKDQKKIFEIAALCAKNDRPYTIFNKTIFTTIQNFVNFGLTDQQQIFEIVQLLAEKYPCSVIDYFKEFRLREPKLILESAKTCLKFLFFNSLNDIQNVKKRIEDEEIKKINFDSLYEINNNSDLAMICAFTKIIFYMEANQILEIIFSKFDSESVKSKLLATFEKISPQKKLETFTMFKNSHIFNEYEIFEFAKLCAKQDQDQQHIFEILQPLAEKYPWFVVDRFNAFGLKEPKLIFELARSCIKIDLELIVKILNEMFNLDYSKETEKFLTTSSELMELYFIHQFSNYDYHGILKKVQKFKPDNLNWLGSICKKIQTLSNEEKKWIFKNHFLELFIDFRSAELRYFLTPILKEVNPDIIKIFDNFPTEKETNEFKLILLVLSYSLKLGMDKNIIIRFTKKISKQLVNNQSKLLQIIYSLNLLNNTDKLDTLQKENIVKRFSNLKLKSVDFYFQILALRFLLTTKQESVLKNITENSLFTDILKDKFIDFIPSGDINDYNSKMNASFLNSRFPMAIFYYAACLKKFGTERITQSLSTFVCSVLNNSFIETRNSKSSNPHLQQLFGKNSELEKKWQTSIEIQPVIQAFDNSERTSMFDWLKTCSSNGHFGNISDYPIIQQFLNFSKEEECQNYLKKIDKQNSGDIKEKFQFAVISLCKEEKNEFKIIRLKEVEELLTNSTIEFKNDVKGLINMLSRPNTGSKEMFAVETEDPYDLLLCGTEVDGSCLRIDGDPAYNKGLLGYLLDGKIRLIAIKDKKNQKISARALLRILWNGTKPVLYVDRRYPHFISVYQEQAILNMAKMKAKQMGLELYEKSDTATNISLKSIGGPAPYEYVDGEGVEENGKYTIRNVQKI